MQNLVRIIVVFSLAATLTGCLSSGLAPQTVVPVTPVSPNAVTSAQLLEPLKGGLIGGSLGETLSKAERQRGLIAEYQALETSFGLAPVIWVDEKTGITGEVVAGAPYRVGQQDCRPYTHKLTVKKLVTNASGSACRQANGSWLLLQ